MKGIGGKVAVVTGGASGIGAATVKRFIASGAKVVIGDINDAKATELAHEVGDNALPVRFDALDVASVEKMIATTVDHFGRLDFLFNNAALMSVEANVNDTDPVNIDFEWWDRIMAANVRGYLAGCKYAIPHMLEQGKGSIVMTSSGAGILGSMSNIAYGASKAAVINLVRNIAVIYGKKGLRCNCVSPGPIRTESAEQHFAKVASVLENNTLTPRLGKPEDVAGMVVYLCSDDADFITGQNISVDGGITMHMPHYSDFNRLKLSYC